jgi:hypothetical protein
VRGCVSHIVWLGARGTVHIAHPGIIMAAVFEPLLAVPGMPYHKVISTSPNEHCRHATHTHTHTHINTHKHTHTHTYIVTVNAAV